MSSSRTTTQITTTVGSIPITGGTSNPPLGPTHPSMPDPFDEERELELQLECTQEKKKAEEEAKRRVEEEVARRAAEEEKEKQEAAARAASTKKKEEEESCSGGGVQLPRAFLQRGKASGGDPDDGNDSGDNDDDDKEERAPCERCQIKKIPCLEQVRREGGPSGEQLAVMESQMAQLLADNRALREATSRSHQYLRQLLRRQDEDHARLIAIEARSAMLGPAIPGPSRSVSERPKHLKRRRIIEHGNEEEEEENENEEEQGKEEEGGEEEEEQEEGPVGEREELE
ncbi:hypothetical protein EV359DRAFT_78513 [Lentinula novae-zelandiae]|nr:hypothetical protein EV359DRAFT_78513 [Lentinula novae-zelandiae]